MEIAGAEFFNGVTFLTVLGIIGAVGKWLWTQIKGGMDARVKAFEERETAFERKRDARVLELEETVAQLVAKVDSMAAMQGRQRRAIDLLVIEVARLDPGSRLLIFVRQLLGDDLPFDPLIPSLATSPEPR